MVCFTWEDTQRLLIFTGTLAHDPSVLLITHRVEMARVADRASQLCGGKIVFSGTPSEVAERYKTRRCTACDGEQCSDQ